MTTKRSAEESSQKDSSKKSKTETTTPSTPPPVPTSSTAAIVQFDNQIDEIDKKAEEECWKVIMKWNKKKAPIFEKRHEACKKVEGFWAKVLVNALESFSSISNAESQFIAKYVEDFKIESLEGVGSFRVTLKLKDSAGEICSPLVLVKEVSACDDKEIYQTMKKTELKFKNEESDVFKLSKVEEAVIHKRFCETIGEAGLGDDFDISHDSVTQSLLAWFNTDEGSSKEEEQLDYSMLSNFWNNPSALLEISSALTSNEDDEDDNEDEEK